MITRRTLLKAIGAIVAEVASYQLDDQLSTLEQSRVSKLFEKFRNGTYNEHTFPKLDRSDIPELLELSSKTNLLKSHPVNPLSSLAGDSPTEGVVALWLVDGIRQGGKYPSLNPLLLHVDQKKTAKEKQASAAKSYKIWWEKVKELSPDEAKKVPLKLEESLFWYGGSNQ